MPEEAPQVIVTFYENFHWEEVDISGVFPGASSQWEERRLYHVHEVIMELSGSEFVVVEERDYTEEAFALSIKLNVSVRGSGGTWALKFHLNGEDFETGPIPWEFDAATVRAALPSGLADPGDLHIERRVVKGGGSEVEAGEAQWLKVTDVEPNVVQIEVFVESGIQRPGSGSSYQGIDIDLGAVIEKKPRYDTTDYEVPLEEGDCGAGGAPEPEPGAIQIENPCSGRKAVFRPVSGHRS